MHVRHEYKLFKDEVNYTQLVVGNVPILAEINRAIAAFGHHPYNKKADFVYCNFPTLSYNNCQNHVTIKKELGQNNNSYKKTKSPKTEPLGFQICGTRTDTYK